MKILRHIDENLEKILCIILLAAMTLTSLLQVFARTAKVPLAWTEELARYLFIWLIYVSCSYAIKHRRHLKIEAIFLLFKSTGRKLLRLISNACFLIFTVVMTYEGFLMVQRLMFINKQKSAAMQISMAIPYSAIFAGFFLMSIRLIQDSYKIIKEKEEI